MRIKVNIGGTAKNLKILIFCGDSPKQNYKKHIQNVHGSTGREDTKKSYPQEDYNERQF